MVESEQAYPMVLEPLPRPAARPPRLQWAAVLPAAAPNDSVIDEGNWVAASQSGDRAAFERIVTALPGATPPVRQLLGQRVRAAGGVTMAPIGGGFALPHPSARITLGRDSGTVALLLLRDDLPLPEPPVDGLPVRRLFFFIAPSPRAHLDLLARLSRGLGCGPLRELVEKHAPDAEIFQAVDAMDAAPAAPPQPEVQP